MTANQAAGVCADCRRPARAATRGLCGLCYARHYAAGTHTEFPQTPRPGRKKCAQDGCDRKIYARGRCTSCYESHLRRQMAYGRWESMFVDADPVRAHVLELRAAGIGNACLASLSGVNHKSIQQMITGRPERGEGPSKKVLRTTADRILAVTIPTSPLDPRRSPGSVVDATGTRRRLQALAAIGWTQAVLCRRLGVTQSNGQRMFIDQAGVTVATARKVADLYDEIAMTPGPSKRAADIAGERAWPKPLEWDDDLIDDPDAVPDFGLDTIGRRRASKWWRTQPCTVDDCDKTRVGHAIYLCSRHYQLELAAQRAAA